MCESCDDERDELLSRRIEYKHPSGAPVEFAVVYRVTRECGGPEEGGWWYDAGIVERVFVLPEDQSIRSSLLEQLHTEHARPARFSSEPSWKVIVESTGLEPADFPAVRPHYE